MEKEGFFTNPINLVEIWHSSLFADYKFLTIWFFFSFSYILNQLRRSDREFLYFWSCSTKLLTKMKWIIFCPFKGLVVHCFMQRSRVGLSFGHNFLSKNSGINTWCWNFHQKQRRLGLHWIAGGFTVGIKLVRMSKFKSNLEVLDNGQGINLRIGWFIWMWTCNKFFNREILPFSRNGFGIIQQT